MLHNENRFDFFKLITPILVTISIVFINLLSNRIDKLDKKIEEIDNKLFVHLTNHEIHTPRGCIVDQEVFKLHCQYEEERFKAVIDYLNQIYVKRGSVKLDVD